MNAAKTVSKIRWTGTQTEKVARRAGELMASGGAHSWTDAIDKAQHEVLEKDFWRPRTSIAGSVTKIQELLKHLKQVDGQRAAEELAAAEAAKPKAPPTINEMLDGIVNAMVNMAAGQLKDRLVKRFMDEAPAALAAAEDEFIKRLQAARSQTGTGKVQLKKVMIIGVGSDEINVLEEAYDGQLDLRIFTKHDKVLRIKRQASHCDYVVVMTDHVGHPFQEAVREHPGLLFVKGTTSNLKKTLTELAMH